MSHFGFHPLVSVCIQTYQHAAYIKECLDSVLMQQKNFPFEIILGEDDSTDGTRKICEEYAEKYPNIIQLFKRSEKDKIYINGQKTGRYNFIQNLNAASGKYIALLDGDDYWIDNRKLQKQVDFMEKDSQLAICCHNTYWQKKTGPLLSPPDENRDVNTVFKLEELLKGNFIPMSSCMILRSCIKDIPEWFWEVPIIDYPLHLHNAQKGNIAYLADVMSVYRIHPGGMWSWQRAPENQIKLWHLFYLMAVNFNGRIAEVMLEKRHHIGIELIRFYKNRLWKKSTWLKEELMQNKFPQDEDLLKLYDSSLSFNNYKQTCINYVRYLVRKFIIDRWVSQTIFIPLIIF